MNVDNVLALGKQMEDLGFGELGGTLLKKICLKPKSFSITHAIKSGNDKITFAVYLKAGPDAAIYELIYFDARLSIETALPITSVNGINLLQLDRQMSGIDWKSFFEPSEGKLWQLSDKASLAEAENIEAIAIALEVLTSGDGKAWALELKAKHWKGMMAEERFSNPRASRSKDEISQRFYCVDGCPMITVDEACRFLKNSLAEKLVNEKKLRAASEGAGAGDSSSDILLKKRRSAKGGRRSKDSHSSK